MVKTPPVKVFRGQHVFYRNEKYIDDLEFVVLGYNGTCCACVSAAPLKDNMPFDINNNNNWETSSLRKYLNEEYVKRFDERCIEIYNNDKIWLLSKEEIEIDKNILPKYSICWWTRSRDVSYADGAWFVYPYGWLANFGNAIDALGVIPACKFNLTSLIVFQEENNIIFESKN